MATKVDDFAKNWVSAADLARALGPRRGPWGRWRLNPEALTLELVGELGWLYEIDLERCTHSAAVLDGLAQLAGKAWVTAEDLGHLVRALDDTLSLQANLCALGKDRRIRKTRVRRLVRATSL